MKTYLEKFNFARECYYGPKLMQEIEAMFKEADGQINALTFDIETRKLEKLQEREEVNDLAELEKQAKTLRGIYISNDSRAVEWEGLASWTKDRWIDLVKKAKEIIGTPNQQELYSKIKALEEQNQALLEELAAANTKTTDLVTSETIAYVILNRFMENSMKDYPSHIQAALLDIARQNLNRQS